MKYEKNSLDIKFIKTCKQGSFLPTFNANYVLKQRIGRIIMEDELQRKNQEKKET